MCGAIVLKADIRQRVATPLTPYCSDLPEGAVTVRAEKKELSRWAN